MLPHKDTTVTQKALLCHALGTLAIPYFALGDEKVWGATAMVLAELAALLE